jgi:hypothetical protein
MRKFAFIVAGFVFLALAISSCSKSALDQPGFPGFRCGTGSVEYIADTAFYTKDASARGTVIKAYTKDSLRFAFYLNAADTNGTFPIDTNRNNPNIAYYYDAANVRYQSTSGTLYITQYFNDSLAKITGTFNFQGRSPDGTMINISYGYFNNIPRH